MRISHKTLALLSIEGDAEAEDLLSILELDTPVYWSHGHFYSIWDANAIRVRYT